MGNTVHFSHGSDVVVGILEANKAVALGLSCTFVSHHLMTTILEMNSVPYYIQICSQGDSHINTVSVKVQREQSDNRVF